MSLGTPSRPRALCAGPRLALVAALAGLLLAPAGLTAPARAETGGPGGPDDPDLQQRLGDLAVVHGKRVLDAGHVDMGPKIVDGRWRLLVHDDVAKADAKATSVWRYPDETVFRLTDAAELTVPDDDAYSFIGARAGAPVWVMPQTQDPDVVWLGWNTQDPQVMRSIDRGVTLSLTGVQGPGDVSVYLQSGTFGAPQVLWTSQKQGVQSVFVDVNTHTHANWTFTEPGVYLLRLRAEADLRDGSHVSDSQLVRVAVGSRTSTAAALSTAWSGPPEPTSTEAGTTASLSEAAAPAADDGASALVPLLLAAIGVVALALVAGVALTVVRGQRARAAALAGREPTA